MSHIAYNRSTPFGSLTSDAVNRLIQLRQDVNRLMSVANSLTAGGASAVNLESGDGAASFGMPAGAGQTYYTDLQSIQAGLNAISAATLADLDLG